MDKLVDNRSPAASSEIGTPTTEVPKKNYVKLPPNEFVVSIDHILEQICSYLDLPDLFTCRLVSHRFLQFAQIPLEKQIKLRFTDDYKQLKECEYTGNNRVDYSERTLSQLTKLIEQSSSLALETKSKLIRFPCTRFDFRDARLGDDVLQAFLNIHGQRIRQLHISSYPKDTTHEKILMHQLSHLLTTQAPHLENLYLAVNPTVSWMQGVPVQNQSSVFQILSSRSHRSPLLKTDPEYQQISFRAESQLRKSSLKVLEINGAGFAKILELIFQLSPKLEEFGCSENYNFFLYLLEPVRRVHLLKSLTFEPVEERDSPRDNCFNTECNFNIEALEKISQDNFLRLKELRIDFQAVVPPCHFSTEFENRVASVINGIWERSRETLESLHLTSYFFLRGMKMPGTMPKVKEITIFDFDERDEGDANETVFPKGFLLSETFPSLTCVSLSFHLSIDYYEIDHVDAFLNCLDFQGYGEALSLSVTKVVLDRVSICLGDDSAISAYIWRRVRKYFPRAEIKIDNVF